MASKNVETLRAAHESWNRRDFAGVVRNAAEGLVYTEFTVEGTNDGLFGSLKPTGRKMSLPFCEICHFDTQGRPDSGTCYYDQYTLLTQLGHIQPLAAAA
jgi:hypothetical protein